MRIFMACPAPPRSRRGNRVTAARWADLLRQLGHDVHIGQEYDDSPADLVVALHARKSAAAVAAFREAHPDRPIIMCLTGTDIYSDLPAGNADAIRSLDSADRIVALQHLAMDGLRPAWRRKARTILQSAEPLANPPAKSSRAFEVCVIGHLREEKDSFRAAFALRHIPAESRIRIRHAGGAYAATWADEARALTDNEPRYRWLGELPGGEARQVLARSRLMVISSRLEGGANVVSEAIVLGTPILASRIPGNVGLLGENYPGYFTVEDEKALAELMLRAEREPSFYRRLENACDALQPLFRPDRELDAWAKLLDEASGRR
ncbi:MAG: TIGR04348 family glycosyltransferase [Gemmataceae bacterium]|nr:TIGR04348 family glycosyltransferase [Gemmataceae bacterium]